MSTYESFRSRFNGGGREERERGKVNNAKINLR